MAIIKGRVEYLQPNYDLRTLLLYNRYITNIEDITEKINMFKSRKGSMHVYINYYSYMKKYEVLEIKDIQNRMYEGEYIILEGESYRILKVEIEDNTLVYCIDKTIKQVKDEECYNKINKMLEDFIDDQITYYNKKLEEFSELKTEEHKKNKSIFKRMFNME